MIYGGNSGEEGLVLYIFNRQSFYSVFYVIRLLYCTRHIHRQSFQLFNFIRVDWVLNEKRINFNELRVGVYKLVGSGKKSYYYDGHKRFWFIHWLAQAKLDTPLGVLS